MLAKRTSAKVVPVGIVGTHIAWSRGSKLKRHRITVVYGEPFTYDECAKGANERENRELFALELQKRIARLCEENGLSLKIERSSENSRSSGALSQST